MTCKFRYARFYTLCGVVLLLFLLMQTPSVIAQPQIQPQTQPQPQDTAAKTIQPVRVTGGITLSGDYYTASGVEARRPTSILQAIARVNVQLFEQVSLPFEAFIGTGNSGFRQPFNQFGVSPRFGNWLTLHAGWFSTRFSDFTFGDVRMLGGGVELTPGNFRLSAIYGSTNQAVPYEPTAQGAPVGAFAAYNRPIYGVKIGYGDENVAFVNLNVVRVADDPASLALPQDSIAASRVIAAPQENVVASLQFGFGFLDGKIRFTSEVAASLYSSNTRADELFEGNLTSTSASVRLPVVLPRELFTPRLSSQIDAAARATLTIAPSQDFGVNLTGQYIGPGFVTLGYAQLQNDVLEGTVAPFFRLWNGAVTARGTFGVRVNNLLANRFATAQRVIGSASLSIQPVQAFGVDVNYSNYGMRSTPRRDTLRIENIAQSLTVSPRVSFGAFGGTSGIFGSYALNTVDDQNIVTKQTNTNTTQTATLAWSLGLPSGLALTTTGFYSQLAQTTLSTHIVNIGQTIGYGFFEGVLNTSLTLGYGQVASSITLAGATTDATDGQITGSLTASLLLGEAGKFGTLALSLNNNNYAYGDGGTVGAGVGIGQSRQNFGEWMGSLVYTIGF
jgi:hypothetical protein